MSVEEEDVLWEENHPPFYQWMEGDSLAPPCHSEKDVIEPMLQFVGQHLPAGFVELPENGLFYDIGCGDGRVCIAATRKLHCRSIGVEIEDFLIARFRSAVEREGLQEMVQVIHGDLQEMRIEIAPSGTVVSMYLLPEAIEVIKPMLIDALQRGAVVVCNSWGIKGLTPQAKACGGENGTVNFFLYTSQSVEG